MNMIFYRLLPYTFIYQNISLLVRSLQKETYMKWQGGMSSWGEQARFLSLSRRSGKRKEEHKKLS